MTFENGSDRAAGKVDVLIVGAGPAGLMAAEVLGAAGRQVRVTDAMPSVGRKFLMAGKSGLNLTKEEPDDPFRAAFGDIPDQMTTALAAFGPREVIAWSEGLGSSVFTGSTGRVFPHAMKASPLLRAWLARLAGLGVEVRTRWRWTGWDDAGSVFSTPQGSVRLDADVTIFALGGASWRRLGSTGDWAEAFRADGHAITPFQPANMGFAARWSPHMERHFGAPVKSTRLSAGPLSGRGEWVISARGLEGGGIYEVSRAVRKGHPLALDLAPDLTVEEVAARLSRGKAKDSMANLLRKTLGMSPEARALLMEWGRPLPAAPEDLARRIKGLEAQLAGPLPMDGAISTAGGVAWEALDGFELKSRRGSFVAGEMLDWEAPTGGYLITGCLATGRAAAEQALGLRV